MLAVVDDRDESAKAALRQKEADLTEALKDQQDLFTLVSSIPCVCFTKPILSHHERADSYSSQDILIQLIGFYH